METRLTPEDRGKIVKNIREKYIKVASSPEGLFRYPTGRKGIEALAYDTEKIGDLPDDVIFSYCGVGNPFALGPIGRGEVVLDIGCGGGVDTLVSATMVGREGKVMGIDMVSEMLKRAMENVGKTTLKNVSFQEASAEDLPFADEIFDVVISNGVFNLVPDKAKALSEVFRVLKPGGRVMIADQVLTGLLPNDPRARIESWFR